MFNLILASAMAATLGEPCSFNQTFDAAVFMYQGSSITANHCDDQKLVTASASLSAQKSYLLQTRQLTPFTAANMVARRDLGLSQADSLALAKTDSDFPFYATVTNPGNAELEIAKVIALDKKQPVGSQLQPRFDTSENIAAGSVRILIKGRTVRFVRASSAGPSEVRAQISSSLIEDATVKLKVSFSDGQLNLSVCSDDAKTSCAQYTTTQSFGTAAPDILVGAGVPVNSSTTVAYCKSASSAGCAQP
jgi:hypothetical protein